MQITLYLVLLLAVVSASANNLDYLLSSEYLLSDIVPTVEPSAEPSVAPTMDPTVQPTTAPTADPTALPTTAPTTNPTVAPTTNPTVAPTTNPTVAPTTNPTVAPTTNPTVAPTTNPTTQPSTVPTIAPTRAPTTAPTAVPTAPTPAPTLVPTAVPTTAAPSAKPTKMPTARPTSAAPSAAPTLIPTAAPTNINLVSFHTKQQFFGLGRSQYESNKDVFDTTIRQSIAQTMTGVQEENVKDLVVSFITSTSLRRMLATESTFASYNIVVNSDTVTFETLKSQLEAASVTGGDLDTFIATNAVNNGITDFTVGEPEVEDNLAPRESSERLTGTQITGLIIGIFLFLGLLATIIAFVIYTKSTAASATTGAAATADVVATTDVPAPISDTA